MERLPRHYDAKAYETEKPEYFSYTDFPDHKLRVTATIDLINWFKQSQLKTTHFDSVADLSAGDGSIINSVNARNKYLGNFGDGYEYSGDILKTIEQIPSVDLFINTETLEHLPTPQEVLNKIRTKTKYLCLSTPLDEKGTIWGHAIGHLWVWGKEDILKMLKKAGFEPIVYQEIHFFDPSLTLNYQLWICK